MRVLPAVLLVAAVCAAVAQTDCSAVWFLNQTYVQLPAQYQAYGLPVYKFVPYPNAGPNDVRYMYFNKNLVSGGSAQGWCTGLAVVDGPYVFYATFTTPELGPRPWNVPNPWLTTTVTAPAGVTVPTPQCLISGSAYHPHPGAQAEAPVKVELPGELCSSLTEEKVATVLGSIPGVSKAKLSCPMLELSCAGEGASMACPALRERLLSPTSALRHALVAAAAANHPTPAAATAATAAP